MKKPKQKMEIEDLAVMVKNSFDHMDEKFNKRFDEVDKRFDGVDSRLETLENGMDTLNRKMDGLELKVSSYASSWDKNFDNLHDWVEEIEKRVNKIEDRVVGVK